MTSENTAIQQDLSSIISRDSVTLRQSSGGREVDPLELLSILLSKIGWVIVSAVLCGVIAYSYSYYLVTPLYRSTVKLHVMNTANIVINISDLEVGASLSKDYEEIVFTWEVMSQTIDKLNLSYDVDTLRKMISINNPDETRIMEITVESSDPDEAALIANTLMTVVNDYITQVMGVIKPNVISKALASARPSSPNKTINTLLGATLGGILCGLAIVIMFILDDRIKSPKDILKAAGIPTLAILPRLHKSTKSGIKTKTAVIPLQTRQNKAITDKTGGKKSPDRHTGKLVINAFPVQNPAATEEMNSMWAFLSHANADLAAVSFSSCQLDSSQFSSVLNLARTITSIGKSVLVIDANFRKSDIVERCHIISLNGKIWGLSHYLTQKCPLEQTIYETNISLLSVILAGEAVPDSYVALNSPLFPKMLDVIRGSYDVILIDTTSVGTLIDAAIIAGCCDGTVFAVDEGQTTREELAEACSRIEGMGGTVLGAVLTKKETSSYSIKKYYRKRNDRRDAIPYSNHSGSGD